MEQQNRRVSKEWILTTQRRYPMSDSTGYDDLLSEMTRTIERQRKLLDEQSELITKLLIREKQTVTTEWIENKTNQMEQMFMQPQRRKDREFFIRKLYEDMNIEVSDE